MEKGINIMIPFINLLKFPLDKKTIKHASRTKITIKILLAVKLTAKSELQKNRDDTVCKSL
jgi:hypothetical protein